MVFPKVNGQKQVKLANNNKNIIKKVYCTNTVSIAYTSYI